MFCAAKTRLLGVGLTILGGVGLAGCALGGTPASSDAVDAAVIVTHDAAAPQPDAAPGSPWEPGLPLIDQVSWQTPEVATFALG